MFAVEESIRADLPAGFDLPCVVQAERVCACAQQEPLQELFARLTQLLGTKPTTLPLPSHAQTNRAAPRKELPRSDPDTFPTWTGTSRGTGRSGVARAEGAQPCPVTGCRWDLGLLWGQRWGSQHQDPIPCQGPHRMGMSQHGTPRSSNGHPKPCTSVPLPKRGRDPPRKVVPLSLHARWEQGAVASNALRPHGAGPGRDAAGWHPGGQQRCRALREAKQHWRHS